MHNQQPYVTVGVPVFNGAQYLSSALDALLAQTFTDFEIIISDNASTDETEAICRSYAARDARIKYVRNETNLGAAPNFNQLVQMAAGTYFKWAAYDDVCAPTYLERCVDILEHDPSVLVCHSQTIYIDSTGEPYAPPGTQDDHLHLQALQPYRRLHAYLFRPSDRWNAIFGLIRTEELKKTPLIGSYPLSDQVLLGELALRGKIYRVPEPLFLRRDHPKTAMKANRTDNAYAVWFNSANRGKFVLPRYLKAFLEYLRSVRRVDLPWHERLPCYLSILQWGVQYVLWKPFAFQSGRLYRLLTSGEKRKQLVKTMIGK